MQVSRLRKNRVFALIFAVIVVYLFFRIKTYEHVASVTLKKTNPRDAWEFVADFSNMKYLNPTILDFNILSEKGNYAHWQYSTEYSENLSHWPYLRNTATAHFSINGSHKNNIYNVHSVHNTCLLKGYFCLESISRFEFSRKSDSPGDAVCEEYVQYQCPAILSHFCSREVIFQRNAIMKNLQLHFAW